MHDLRKILTTDEWNAVLSLNDVVRDEDWIWAMCCTVYGKDMRELSDVYRYIGHLVVRRFEGLERCVRGELFPFARLLGGLSGLYPEENVPDAETVGFCNRMRDMAYRLKRDDGGGLGRFLSLWRVPRAGWMRVIADLKDGSGESVAQHSFKTALYAGCLYPEAFADAFLMGLVHDHAELVVGDLTPAEVSCREEKWARECAAYRIMLSESDLGPNVTQWLWDAFEACQGESEQISGCLHMADKVDMALQALSYEGHFGVDLREFLDSSAKVLLPPEV